MLRTIGAFLTILTLVPLPCNQAIAQTARDPIAPDLTVMHRSTVPANYNEDVKLFVREHDGTPPNKPRKAVLMLHGRSVPALAGFDLDTTSTRSIHGRYSWAAELAKVGFDVFVMDLQGSGRSRADVVDGSPHLKMDDACNANPLQQTDLLVDPNGAPLPKACDPTYPYQLNNSQG